MNRSIRNSSELWDRAVWMLQEHKAEYRSQWEAMVSIAANIGCSAAALRKWVRRSENADSSGIGLRRPSVRGRWLGFLNLIVAPQHDRHGK